MLLQELQINTVNNKFPPVNTDWFFIVRTGPIFLPGCNQSGLALFNFRLDCIPHGYIFTVENESALLSVVFFKTVH